MVLQLGADCFADKKQWKNFFQKRRKTQRQCEHGKHKHKHKEKSLKKGSSVVTGFIHKSGERGGLGIMEGFLWLQQENKWGRYYCIADNDVFEWFKTSAKDVV